MRELAARTGIESIRYTAKNLRDLSMKIAAITSIAGFLAAIALASWIYSGNAERSAVAESAALFDASLPVEQRIAALEQAVSDERAARQLLQEELFYLTSELQRRSVGGEPGRAGDADTAQAESLASGAISRREEFIRSNSPEYRREQLIEAGFLPSQANLIARREAELRMEEIEARFEAERSGDIGAYWRNRNDMNDTLRKELGDEDYERYLSASGQPTTIQISSVIEFSPAQTAGLQTGDEIVRYDGERVFSLSDLSRQAAAGQRGENVVVDIVRNGTPMQIVLPRGPLGITGGRWR